MQVNRRCLELEISLQLSVEREAETKTRTEKANLGLSEKLKQLERDFSNLSIVNGQVTLNPQRIGELERKTGMCLFHHSKSVSALNLVVFFLD